MSVVLAVIGAVFLGCFWHLGSTALRRFGDFHDMINGHFGMDEGSVKSRITDLEHLVDALPKRWGEIVKEASRLDGRARHHVRRVREELASHGFEDDAIEALAGELQLGDVEGGPASGVPAVHQAVEPQPEAAIAPANGTEDWQSWARRVKFGA